MESIIQKLAAIQQDIKCPKNLENTFGGYKYRSAESILEALKPVMAKYKVTLVLSDDIRMVGDRIYVMAEAKLIDLENNGASINTYAYAREALERPKMDAAQLTGSASSYARKYALNGLLLLDDVKDPDTDEFMKQSRPEPTASKLSKDDLNKFLYDLQKAGAKPEAVCRIYKLKRIEDITVAQANDWFAKAHGNNRNN